MVVRPRICVGSRKAYGSAVRPAQSSFCYESPSRLYVAYPVIYVRKTCIRYHVGIILNRQRSNLDVAVELDLTAKEVHRDQIIISQPNVFSPKSVESALPDCAYHSLSTVLPGTRRTIRSQW